MILQIESTPPLRLCSSAAARSGRRSGADRLCPGGSTLLPDDVTTEVLLRCQSVMGVAAQGEVLDARRASTCMRVPVMELEPGLLAATLAARVEIRAARFVALPDAAAHCGRNVATQLG